MSSPSLFPRVSVLLVGGTVLATAVWLGAGLVHGPTRKHSLAAQEQALTQTEPAAAAAPKRARTATTQVVATQEPRPATAPITDDAFLNQHYQNQVVADVRPADSPEQFEQKVRALDPSYAKLLDENAELDRKLARQNAAAANAPEPRRGTDDER